jgi:S-layer homology domain
MWYHAYICRAYALRVTNGFSDGTFKPNNPVTVLEALAFGFRAFSIETPVAGIGESWHDPVRRLAHEKNILPIDSYTLSTPISRGRATELITRIRTYKHSLSPLDYKSHGCSVGRDLMKKNTITVQGKSREYLLTVPRGYLKVKNYPLIIGIHGRTNSNEQVQGYMGLNKTSDFIVAYPLGLDASG